MNVTKITMARLYNSGNYEHTRIELTVEVAPGESATTAFTAVDNILRALNPKLPHTSHEQLAREKEEIERTIQMTPEQFDRVHGFTDKAAWTAAQIASWEERSKETNEYWLRRSKAKKALDDLGGTVVDTDHKDDWRDEGY